MGNPDVSIVARAEEELRRCCVLLGHRFESGIPMEHLSVHIAGLKPSRGRRRGIAQEHGPPTVRMPAAALAGSATEVLADLLHAMVHWVNGLHGVADCCFRGYHNRHFRDLAWAVGFDIDARLPRFGWSDTRPAPTLDAQLRQVELDRQAIAPLLDQVPERVRRKPWRCGTNVPTDETTSPYWRSAARLLPTLPRCRLELVREDHVPGNAYPQVYRHGDAAALLWQILCRFDREALAVLFLDRRRRVIGWDIPYIGTMTSARVEPRGVLVPALLVNAESVVVAHNHPSGDPTPSSDDRRFTHRLQQAGAVLGVNLFGSLTLAGAGRWCRVSPAA